MTRCDEFYDKVEKDGNFCGMNEDTLREVLTFIDFINKNPDLSGISEKAGKLLIREKDQEIKANAIKTIGKQITHGNIATAKQVKQILKNLSDRKSTRGGDHKGAAPPAPVHVPHVVFPPKKPDPDTMDVEDLGLLDEEKDYYSGDAPETPDTQENVEPPKAVVDVPQDVTDIEAKMEEERVARAIKDLQKQKEDERQKQKDRREYDDLDEKNENTRMRDDLAVELTDALRRAIKKGILREYVSEALTMALNNVFEPEQKSEETGEGASRDVAKSGGLFK